jgi:aspartokinase
MVKISGILERCGLSYYSVVMPDDKPGAVAEILRRFAEDNINLEYITESTANGSGAVLAFCIHDSDAEGIDTIIRYCNVKVKKMEKVGFIGVYGPHFREKPAIAAMFCNALGESGINIYGISSSISSVACIIKAEELQAAKSALLKIFELP